MNLRYFNVAGADPKMRTGQATPAATHLIKVACETAVGKRAKMQVLGTDYPTPDGTCIRDYIHVSELVQAHSSALAYLRNGGASITLNCGYGRGASVIEVVNAVRRASGRDFPVEVSGRRPGDPPALVANVDRIRATLPCARDFKISTPLSPTRSHGKSSWRACARTPFPDRPENCSVSSLFSRAQFWLENFPLRRQGMLTPAPTGPIRKLTEGGCAITACNRPPTSVTALLPSSGVC